MLPIIAIVGRPNVGKSTLFNRLIGERRAVTSPTPGTTRDRVYHDLVVSQRRALLVDTGGMDFFGKTDLEEDIRTQAQIAIREADVIVLLVDATQPLTTNDIECATLLRKSHKPIVLVAAKTDNKKSEAYLHEFLKLGLGEPLPVSAIHNLGIEDVLQTLGKLVRKILREKKIPTDPTPKKKNAISIAFTGKPNVGKSSLLNALLGQERAIVSDIAGTTVDSMDTELTTEQGDFVLTDTAGIRRRGKVVTDIEKYSVLRAIQAISRSDIACLIMDWTEGVTNQDLHVSEYILSAHKGLIIVINKIDLMEDPRTQQKEFLNELQYRMGYAPWAPVVFISAQKKKNIEQILTLAGEIAASRKQRIQQRMLDLFLETTTKAHPPSRAGNRIRFKRLEQTGINPPIFRFYCSRPDLVHFSYRRFLENELRRLFGFNGTAMVLEFRDITLKPRG